MQVIGLAKLVERHSFILTKLIHHVLEAAEQTVRHMLLVLPHTSHPLLYLQSVGPFRHLLELVNTNHDVFAQLLRYLFWQGKHLFW